MQSLWLYALLLVRAVSDVPSVLPAPGEVWQTDG